jgi:hypothetical protein
VRGCYHNRSAREIITDVVISGSANVGCSRGGLVSCLLRSLSKVGSVRSDAVCGSLIDIRRHLPVGKRLVKRTCEITLSVMSVNTRPEDPEPDAQITQVGGRNI